MPVSEPIATFTRNHPQTGEKQTRNAYSPDERVQLTADGWLEQKTSKPSSSTSGGSTSAGRSSGGSTSSS